MPAVVLSGTITIETEMTLGLTKTEYLWATKGDIQRYLNDESVITIGDGTDYTYPEEDAQNMENGVVRSIISYLSSFYEIDIDTDVTVLNEIAAMLTAARIGVAFSSAISNDPTSWAYRYENSAWASLKQHAINQDIAELTPRAIPLWQRLIYGKRREQTITQEVR